MLKLTKIKGGKYTINGVIIEKYNNLWYAYDEKTGQSVVDCERTLAEIKNSLNGYFKTFLTEIFRK